MKKENLRLTNSSMTPSDMESPIAGTFTTVAIIIKKLESEKEQKWWMTTFESSMLPNWMKILTCEGSASIMHILHKL